MRAALPLLFALGCQASVPEIRVDTATLGPVVPADFVGLSLEYDLIASHLGTGVAPNLVYRQLMRNLGGGTLRVGGNSEDEACWNPSGAPLPAGCRFSITPEIIRTIFSAVSETGWTVIPGLNLGIADPLQAASYVRDGILPNATATNLLALEIGNEPDIYSTRPPVPIRPPGYAESDHQAEFLSYADAISRVPGGAALPLSGPATCCGWVSDLGAFARGVVPALGNRLARLTFHYYALEICGNAPRSNASIPNLLSESTATAWRSRVTASAQAAKDAGRALQVDEASSVACGGGGPYGVSDTFAAALWALDFLFTAAEAGAAGVNFHSYGRGAYAPIHVDSSGTTYTNQVRPLYYAMLLFAREAAGRAMARVQMTGGGAHLGAFAVIEGSGAKLFLINRDLQSGQDLVVAPAAPTSSATLLLLAAPSLDDTANTLLGGQAIDPATGVLPALAPIPLATDSQGRIHLHLPLASAGVVTLSQ